MRNVGYSNLLALLIVATAYLPFSPLNADIDYHHTTSVIDNNVLTQLTLYVIPTLALVALALSIFALIHRKPLSPVRVLLTIAFTVFTGFIFNNSNSIDNEAKALAVFNDVDSSFLLANSYLKGGYLEASTNKAIEHYQRYLKNGENRKNYLQAQDELIKLYISKKQYDEGSFELASSINNRESEEAATAEVLTFLGNHYYDGDGVKQDYLQAKKLYLQAAKTGHAKAQSYLGAMYSFGNGVEQNYVTALRRLSSTIQLCNFL